MTNPQTFKIEYRLLDGEGFVRKSGTATIKNAHGEFEAKAKFLNAVEKRHGRNYKVEIIKCALDFGSLLNRILGK